MSGTQIGLLFNIGPRISAQVLGLPYQQYRPNGSYQPLNFGNLLATIPVWITADAKGMGTRPFTYAKPVCFGMFDPVVVNDGDYFVGPFGTFFVASSDGVMPMQLVRCNQTVTVSRPTDGPVGSSFYGGVAVGSTLLTSWPASVIQGTKGEKGETALPGDTRLAWAAVLLPSTGDVEILPGDVITTEQTTPMIYTVSSCELTPLGWRLSAATAVV